MNSKIQTAISHKMALLTATVVLLLFATCKKQACQDVVCSANAVCVNGTCSTVCGPNQHTVADNCVCDSGWIGESCQIYAARYSGRYHFVGNWSGGFGGGPYSSGSIDDTSDVFFLHDTLITRGKQFVYISYLNGQDSATYHLFKYVTPYSSGSNYGYIKTRKELPDTLFYSCSEGSLAGGYNTKLTGIKIQ